MIDDDEISERQSVIDALHTELFGSPSANGRDRQPAEPVDLDDQTLLERAMTATNGAKFRALWSDDASSYASRSEADAALALMLAFWTARDVERMDRLFRRSALMRAKWDERRGDSTYGAVTLAGAVERCGETYASRRAAAEPVVVADPATWPTPRPVPTELLPVPAFEMHLLPDSLAAWVGDVAERAQCPPDFVAVAVLVSAAAVVGRQITIRPKQHDDWTVVPNLWGLAVGRPGLMKTAAMHEAQRGLRNLITDARERHQRAMEEYEFSVTGAKARRAAVEKQMRTAADRGDSLEALRGAFEATKVPDPPVERRYVVSDATVEKLGALLNEHPNGLLLFRDELSGFLRTMDREGHENDRAFYCEAWNGTGSYTYDRIGRGTLHVDAACGSLLGGIQPLPLSAYLREAFGRGQDDGLIQRFQLLVFPDASSLWRNVDRWPDSEARRRVVELFDALDRLDLDALGAHRDDGLPFLRFTPEAQARFDAWRGALEHRLRRADADEHPVLVSHLAKYRSLVPSLALLFHVIDCVDRGAGGPVSDVAADRALAWGAYLEPHARRVYEDITAIGRQGAATLAKRLAGGDLPTPFVARDVRLKGWAGLATPEDILTALDRLEPLGWVRRESVRRPGGGRPTVQFHVNPAVAGGQR